MSSRCARIAALSEDSSADDAIRAARRVWYCVRQHDPGKTDERYWLMNYEATRKGERWLVEQILPPGYVGGLTIELSANDGRLINYSIGG